MKKIEVEEKDYLEALRIKHERAYKIETLENQQQEFIEWLKNEMNKIEDSTFLGIIEQKIFLATYETVLQKYKEIIGD